MKSKKKKKIRSDFRLLSCVVLPPLYTTFLFSSFLYVGNDTLNSSHLLLLLYFINFISFRDIYITINACNVTITNERWQKK